MSPNNQSGPVNNWVYGYYQIPYNSTSPQASDFQLMTQQIPSGDFGWWGVDFDHLWTSLDAFGGHPNSVLTDLHQSPYCDPTLGGSPGNCGIGPDLRSADAPYMIDQWAVRRYVVPSGFNGIVTITMSVQKDPRTTGMDANGDMNYAILYDGGNAQILQSLAIGPVSPFTVNTATFQVAVHAGDFLDFAINPNSNDFSDGEFQLITIQAVPEPASILLVAGGLGLLAWKRRKNLIGRS